MKNHLLEISRKELQKKPSKERLQLHRNAVFEEIAKDLLRRRFQEQQQPAKTASTGASRQGKKYQKGFKVSLSAFGRVLGSFCNIGQSHPEKQQIQQLWKACAEGDVEVFINSVFAAKDVQVVNKFGFGKVVSNPLQRENPYVEHGPFLFSEAKQTGSLFKANAEGSCPLQAKQIPQRMIYRHCRTSVQPPMNFDTNLIQQSAKLPAKSLELEWVYGYGRGEQMCGRNLVVVGGGSTIVYTAAAVGIVHDLKKEKQSFFLGHTDDISALAVDGSGMHAATGQMGKSPFINVWDIETVKLRSQLGKGFFERQVCCLAFSPDGSRIVAVSGDDHHMMGIWDISSQSLQVEVSSQSGPPPQIMNILWLPVQNEDGEDEVVTVGKSHMKVWKIWKETHPPPTKGSAVKPATVTCISSRAGLYGKEAKTPRVLHTVDFAVAQRMIVTGGDNGYIFIWKKASKSSPYACTATFFAHRGGVFALFLEGDNIISGGGDGLVKTWAAAVKEYTEIKSLNVCKDVKDRGTITSHATVAPSIYPKDPKFKSISSIILQENCLGIKIVDLCRLKAGLLVVGTKNGCIVRIDEQTKKEKVVVKAHHSDLYGLSAQGSNTSVFATTGEDGQLIIRDAATRKVINSTILGGRARSIAFSPDGTRLAIGFSLGAFGVYNASTLENLRYVRDCQGHLDEIKFSPNGRLLAVGSHDGLIDLYETKGYAHVKRLTGHNSYITHLDWSKDGRVIQSTCGAYEILYWDVKSGAQMRSTYDSVEANTDWYSWTCTLGFPVMGIWPRYTDGTDVNSAELAKDGKTLVTGDDFGKVKLFSYPCVVREAPNREYAGHSSHVMNTRFTGDGRWLLSVGGHDSSVFQWRVVG